MKHLIKELQNRFKQNADLQTKAWFENYLRGSISYYGIKTPEIKKIVTQWVKDNSIEKEDLKKQLLLAESLFSLPHAEEKLAGTLYIQYYLLKKLSSEKILKLAEKCFAKAYFFDWSTADWFTVRVLSPLVKTEEVCLKRMEEWTNSKNLWQRRASIVSLRPLVKEKKHVAQIKRTVSKLVKDSKRFIQTGIGWTLSDLSKHFPKEASLIIEKHFEKLSLEVIDRHTKYLAQHKNYKKRKRRQIK
ncbi:MAG: DNA alkylation repair protein [Bdellovibrionales bacterium]|nr:DNA alkylation repair protein [Bdellovibrionales bacterium]